MLDVPGADQSTSAWGHDETEIIDEAFGNGVLFCIVLLDRAYQRERWYNYRRSNLLDVLARRKGFILPVQVGDDEVEIKGLTTLGKITVATGDAAAIVQVFLEKFKEVSAIQRPELTVPQDLGHILQLYNEKLKLVVLGEYFDVSNKIGYQVCSARDPLTNRSTLFILIEPGADLDRTAARVMNRHRRDLADEFVVALVPRGANDSEDAQRLAFAKRALGAVNVFVIDQFIWQQCTPAYFHDPDPPFRIAGFVEPSINGPSDRSVLGFLEDWYLHHPSPILLVRGSGGIGKTTLAHWFSNRVSATGKKVIFVGDDAIIDYFLKAPENFREAFTSRVPSSRLPPVGW